MRFLHCLHLFKIQPVIIFEITFTQIYLSFTSLNKIKNEPPSTVRTFYPPCRVAILLEKIIKVQYGIHYSLNIFPVLLEKADNMNVFLNFHATTVLVVLLLYFGQ